ncbi:MAG: class I SAM-dependent methyltransferase [Chlorobiaceae bacterium]|nr:class I SAM-dependent methyltransferase [Chlorobiaceae bacterium]
MLQLKTAGYIALDNLRSRKCFPPVWQNMTELEKSTDEFISIFREERFNVSKELGGGYLFEEVIDRFVRTDDRELMDDSRIPEQERLESVKALERQNAFMQLYPRHIDILLPHIRQASERFRREVKILELASGSGGLALALASELKRKKFPARITGSDIVPSYIEESNRRTAGQNLPVEFMELNAFDMKRLGPDEFDIIITSQSMHHFSPGQLAVMIAQAGQHATTAFIGIDGYRSALLGLGVPFVAGLQAIPSFALDGLISARKFYSELELAIIAETAAGRHHHEVDCLWPLSVLTVHFN